MWFSLSATDADTDDLSYSFSVNTAVAQAYTLKTQLGLTTYLPQFDNFGGVGFKWMRSNVGVYYYMKSTGEIYQYLGAQVGQVDASYAADPQSLIDLTSMAAPETTFAYVGGNLTVTPPADFVGTFQVDVTATDGAAPITDTFTVTVTNDGPVWETSPAIRPCRTMTIRW